MNKIVILVVLPCIIAVALSQIVQLGAGQQFVQSGIGYPYGQYGYGQQTRLPASRNVAPYYNYAVNSYQAARQARLYNLLLGGLFFLNLFNFTGNRIVG